MKRVVFVPNKGAHDYSPAEKYGELVFLSEGLEVTRNDFGLISRLALEMKEASKPDDLIMVTGLASHLAILAGAFAHKHGRLNLLIYDGARQEYREKNVYYKGKGEE